MKLIIFFIAAVLAVSVIAGCGKISKPYVMQTDRVDQSVSQGNRGYLVGTPPPADDRTGLKRPWIAIDVDLPAKEEEVK